ncbi:MAG: efflux RND transporter periplasmic adaptor subunit [Vicinamibacterales bacterium]
MSTNATTTRPHDINALLATQAPARSWRRRLMWPLIGLLLVVTTIVVVARARTSADTATPAYVTEPVVVGDLDVKVSATGNLQPTNTVDVGSELSGLVEAVLVEENDHVKKGQVLARLDQSKLKDAITQSQAALASAEAGLAQREATVREANAQLSRLQEVSRLSGGKVPSKSEMETAEATAAKAVADRASAQAGVTEARAALSTNETNLSKSFIRSPVDGIVLTRSVEPGQAVAAQLQVATLFAIAEDLRQMELKVNVDEADVGRTRDGQQATFTVDAYPGRVYTADVTRVAYGSTKSGDVVSYAALLAVKNDDLSLRPGMTASAEIASTSVKGALLVPNAALRYTPASSTQQAGRGFVASLMPGPPRMARTQETTQVSKTNGTVWVLRSGEAMAVPVAIGDTNGRFTVVTGGDLHEGDAVITDNAAVQS